MKEQKRKNKENLIGKIIYGFLLFMPLLAMAITCAYAIFNKNAYQSYYGSLTNNETYIAQDMLTINNNEVYYLNTQNYSNSGNGYNLYCNDFEVIEPGSLSTSQYQTMNSYTNMRIYCRSTTPEFYGINEDNSVTWITNNANFVCKFKINNTSQDTRSAVTGFYTIEYEELTYISEVFYYSIDKVEQSNLFNWSKDTGMYTTVHGATELLGITNTFIPMLMSYWLLISVIYIVYDIALIGVHMVHNKIHDFENVM